MRGGDVDLKNYELAEQDYMAGMKYKEIAEKYGVTLNTVKSWKTRYKWSKDGKKGAHTKPEKSMHTKRGAQPGNKNSSGGPPGNKKAEKYGFFSKHLPEETVSIIEEMPKDPLDILWDQIQIAYAAIIRAQKIMYVEDKQDKTKETITYGESSTAYEVQQAWDKHGNFLQAQARAQKTLEGMINRYDDLLHKNWELATEEQRARIERIKADTERIKGGEQASTEDKVAKLFDAIGAELDAE